MEPKNIESSNSSLVSAGNSTSTSNPKNKKNFKAKLKKGPNKKIILGLIFLGLLLIGGGAAYYLTQVQQDLRQQASTPDYPGNCRAVYNGCQTGETEVSKDKCGPNCESNSLLCCQPQSNPNIECDTWDDCGDCGPCIGWRKDGCMIYNSPAYGPGCNPICHYQGRLANNSNMSLAEPVWAQDTEGQDCAHCTVCNNDECVDEPGPSPTPPDTITKPPDDDDDPTPTPEPISPQCTDIQMLDSQGNAITDFDNLEKGQVVKFLCLANNTGQINHYEFRVGKEVSNMGYAVSSLPVDANNRSQNFTIPVHGKFVAQCRICRGANSCQDWEDLNVVDQQINLTPVPPQ